ncbi:MAG: hypothetical protein AAFR53_15805 [Pseudomonadota bacterium]
MSRLLLFVVLALAACNTPTPQFRGVVPLEMTVDGTAYRVFHEGDRAQAMRIGPALRPNRDAAQKITQAIEIATGCAVKGDIQGDVVLSTARVDCGAGARPWPLELKLTIHCQGDKHIGRVYCAAL